ncbi:MAG: prefoldin subunit alpha [Nanoarchaeota archaeon]|nr:prefoldin subunit alpha [Nanoarchaeota archaeon]
MKENDMQQKYVELQMIESQLKQLQQQFASIDQQVNALKKIDEDLSEFEKVKEDSKMFFSLGPGIFAEGTINSKDLLLNVGSSISVKKSIPETKTLISTQVKELDELLLKMQEDMQIAGIRGQEIQQEIMEMNAKKDK